MSPTWETLLAYERRLRLTECGSNLHLWLAFRVLALPRIVDEDYARMYIVSDSSPPYVKNDDRSFCIVDEDDMILEYRHPHRETFRLFFGLGGVYSSVAPNLVDLAKIICYALEKRSDFNFGDCIADQVAKIDKHDQERFAKEVWGTHVPMSDYAGLASLGPEALVRRMWWDVPLGSAADMDLVAELTGCVDPLQALMGRSIQFRDVQKTSRKPTIWVLVGLPGCGKSHWVDAQMQMGVPGRTVISVDRIIDGWAEERGQTYDEVYASIPDRRNASRIAEEQFKEAIKLERDVFHDATNLHPKNRVQHILLKVPHFYTKIAVYFPQPDQAVWEQRLRSRPGKSIPQMVMEKMQKFLKVPTVYEGFDSVIVM